MKLNANDFRKILEEKKKQKKDAETSLMRMQLDLQASIDRRADYLSKIASLALDASLNGLQEITLEIDDEFEYEEYLRQFGFEADSREVITDTLLRKIEQLKPKVLADLHTRLESEIPKMFAVSLPEEGSDLSSAYKEYLSANDMKIQVKYLLKVLAYYNIEYRVNNHLTVDEDAKLWLYLNRLQDLIDFYDVENDTEECYQSFLCWSNEKIEIEEIADDASSYSLLNPVKLRFINSEAGDEFFSKISTQIDEKTDELKSFIQFDLIVNDEGKQISFGDETFIDVPFGSSDLLTIFKKMGFDATGKERAVRGQNVTAFKIKF